MRTLGTMALEALALLWVWAAILLVFALVGCTTVRYEGPGCTLELERFALQGETSVTSTSCTLTVN